MDDILLTHTIEETSINKVIIIHSDIPIDQEEKDGKIDVLTALKNNHHYLFFQAYFQTNYLEDDQIQEIVKRKDTNYFEFLILCLNKYQDIIFLDTTRMEEEQKMQSAFLLIPEKMTSAQYNTLRKYQNYFNKYKNIHMMGGSNLDDELQFYLEAFPINQKIKENDFSHVVSEVLYSYIKKEKSR